MLINQFRKDYLPYLLGIIVPAGVSFLTIPLLKNLLGNEKFGIYSYYASILIIINSAFSGGISQAIIRLQAEYADKTLFFYQSLWLIFFISLIISLPTFIYIQTNYKVFSFSFLFIAVLFVSNFYFSLLAITQSRFLSIKSAISESLRCIIFIVLCFVIVHQFPNKNALSLLFLSLLFSYTVGCIFLFLSNRFSFRKSRFDFFQILQTGKEIFRYGGFLIGWFLCMYLITMSSRFILARFYGKASIGHFTASFDIINKSIILLMSPITIAIFPIVIQAFAEKQYKQVNSLIRLLMVIEFGLLIVAFFVFYYFGFPLLSHLLSTPATNIYLRVDLQILLGTFIWQLAMLQHKYLELYKKTGMMLLFIFITFSVSIISDFGFIKYLGLQYAGVGYLAGGVMYLIFSAIYSRYLYHIQYNSLIKVR